MATSLESLRWRPPTALVIALGAVTSVLLALARAGVGHLAAGAVPRYLNATPLEPPQVAVVTQAVSEALALPGEVLLESLFLMVVLLVLAPTTRGGLGTGLAWVRLMLAYGVFAVASWLGMSVILPGIIIVLGVAFWADPYRLVGHGRRSRQDRRSTARGLLLGGALITSALVGSVLPLFAWTQNNALAITLSTVTSACWLGALAAYAWFHQRG